MPPALSFTSHPLSFLYAEALRCLPHTTKTLWMNIFRAAWFSGPNWVLGTCLPPLADERLQYVDMIVDYSDEEGHPGFVPVLLWSGARDNREPDVVELETRAAASAAEVLASERSRGRTAIWIMTAFGTRFRLWAYVSSGDAEGEMGLRPILPVEGRRGDKETYLETRGNEGALNKVFGMIREVRLPTAEYVDNYVGSEEASRA